MITILPYNISDIRFLIESLIENGIQYERAEFSIHIKLEKKEFDFLRITVPGYYILKKDCYYIYSRIPL